MTTWFTADTHFGHGGALGLFRRPFEGVAAMDEAIVARWRERIAPHDDVWHLGDFAVKVAPERMQALLDRLPGRKRLLVGNNDTDATRALHGWSEVADYAEIGLADHHFVLSHYPMRSWKNDKRGWWQLHGHSHHRLKPLTRQRDVGVDGFDFAPVTLDVLLRRWPPSRQLK